MDTYGTPDGNDQYNLLFEITGKIDSRNAGEHAINIPVNGFTSEVNSYVQNNIIKQKGYQWATGFQNVTHSAKLSASIPEEATSLNFFPDVLHTKYVNLQSSNRTIFEWEIPYERTSFHIDYTIPSEKEYSEYFSNLSILFTGIGTPLVITGIVEFVKSKIKK